MFHHLVLNFYLIFFNFSQGIEGLINLRQLVLSHNLIEKIEYLENCNLIITFLFKLECFKFLQFNNLQIYKSFALS